jgi:hypothetical protein
MGSANKFPYCLSGYDALAVPGLSLFPVLTGIAVMSRRSHNLVKLASSSQNVAAWA